MVLAPAAVGVFGGSASRNVDGPMRGRRVIRSATCHLQPRINESAIVTKGGGGRPRENVKAVVFAHTVGVNVEEISAANGELEPAYWCESKLGVHQTLAAIVLNVGTAVAIER